MTASRSAPTAAIDTCSGNARDARLPRRERHRQRDCGAPRARPELSSAASALTGPIKRYIYAGTGTTLRVYDMDDGHRLVKTINLPHATGQMTGICANVALHTLFMNFKTATGRVIAMDLHTDQEIWWKDVTPGADRGDVSLDGTKLYVPGGEYNSVPIELVLDGRNWQRDQPVHAHAEGP